MRVRLPVLSRLIIALSVTSIFLTPIQSEALSQFKVAESKVWGHTYAGKSQGTPSTRPPKVAYI